MKKKFMLSCLSLMTGIIMAQETAEPVLSFGVMSDLHNQQTLISGSVSSVQLRGTVKEVLETVKTEENLDLLVLNGDFTSDVTIPKANWERVRQLMIDATRSIFPEGEPTPVLYVNGNHEYEVANYDNLPKPYNAGDFYSTPMSTDIGTLSDDECFYEKADNGDLEPINLLAAYHYVIGGFDFVVLNTGKHFFKYAWDYQYSLESVKWVKNKLAQIYENNPDKTVFFLSHLPFADSKSISNSNKGLANCEATRLLKSTLAKYPNLVHFYGHDHGTDYAYIRTSTSQRVTQYDSNAQIYDENPTLFYIRNSVTDTYLGRTEESDNISTFAEKMTATVRESQTEGMYNVIFTTTVAGSNLYCGTSGRFSGNESITDIYLYEVTKTTNSRYTAKRVTSGAPESGKQYLFVGVKDGTYYALTNEPYSSGSGARMVGASVTVSGQSLVYNDRKTTDDYSAVWTLTEAVDEKGTPSFVSAFNGSMRYYENSIDGGSSVNNSRVAQALMVYVYADSIVLQMRNYGETGLINGIEISPIPEAYTIVRKVIGTDKTDNDPLAVEEIKNSDFSANIKGSTLYVNGADPHSVINVMDCLGRNIMTTVTKSANTSVSLPVISKGVYIVSATHKGKTHTVKVGILK